MLGMVKFVVYRAIHLVIRSSSIYPFSLLFPTLSEPARYSPTPEVFQNVNEAGMTLVAFRIPSSYILKLAPHSSRTMARWCQFPSATADTYELVVSFHPASKYPKFTWLLPA